MSFTSVAQTIEMKGEQSTWRGQAEDLKGKRILDHLIQRSDKDEKKWGQKSFFLGDFSLFVHKTLITGRRLDKIGLTWKRALDIDTLTRSCDALVS